MATELEPPATGAVSGAAPLEAEEDEEHWLYGGRYRVPGAARGPAGSGPGPASGPPPVRGRAGPGPAPREGRREGRMSGHLCLGPLRGSGLCPRARRGTRVRPRPPLRSA